MKSLQLPIINEQLTMNLQCLMNNDKLLKIVNGKLKIASRSDASC